MLKIKNCCTVLRESLERLHLILYTASMFFRKIMRKVWRITQIEIKEKMGI